MLNYTMLGRLSSDKRSSLMGPFVSWNENEVFMRSPKEPTPKGLTRKIMLKNYVEEVSNEKHSSLFERSVGEEEKKFLKIVTWLLYSREPHSFNQFCKTFFI